MSRSVEIDRFLEGKKSFVSNIVHDEIVIDFCDEDREHLKEMKQIFEVDDFSANLRAGKNYLELEELKV